MAEQKCTPEAVAAAIQSIIDAGGKITAPAVLSITGGSKSTVCKLIRDWKAANQPTAVATEPKADDLPASLLQGLSEYRERALAAMRQEIEAMREDVRLDRDLNVNELDAAREELEQAKAELATALEAKAKAEATALELEKRELARAGAVSALEGQIKDLKAEHTAQLAAKDEAITAQATAHATELTKARNEAAAATERAEKAEKEAERLAGLVKEVEASEVLAKRLADKEAELDRTRGTLETLQETAKAAREDAKAAREELREATAGRVADLKEAATKPRKDISDVMPPQDRATVAAREDAAKAAAKSSKKEGN